MTSTHRLVRERSGVRSAVIVLGVWVLEIALNLGLAAYARHHDVGLPTAGAVDLVPYLVLAALLLRTGLPGPRRIVGAVGMAAAGLVTAAYVGGQVELRDALGLRGQELVGQLVPTVVPALTVLFFAVARWSRPSLLRGCFVAFIAGDLVHFGINAWAASHFDHAQLLPHTSLRLLVLVVSVLTPVPAILGGYVAWRLRRP